jgi:hypothetical protein
MPSYSESILFVPHGDGRCPFDAKICLGVYNTWQYYEYFEYIIL